jgi:hypothetical protein
MDPYLAIRMTATLASVGGIVTSAEMLSDWRQLRPWFLQPWTEAERSRFSYGRYGCGRPIPRRSLLYAIQWAKLATFAVLLLTALLSRPFWVAALFAGLLLHFEMRLKRIAGDGADQMTALVSMAVGMGSITSDKHLTQIALFFIAGQAFLAYLTAGGVKLFSIQWMRQGVLGKILNTGTYGSAGIAHLFQEFPKVDI